MRQYKKENVLQDVETKIICNRCGFELDVENESMEVFMVEYIHKFKIAFGYVSNNDGEIWSFDLCEDCIKEIAVQFKIPVDVITCL